MNQLIVDIGGVKVGLFGLTIDKKVPEYVSYIDPDHETIAGTRTADLREQGAEVVIAVTHLEVASDTAVLDRLGDAGPDLIVGGHDHALVTEVVHGRFVLKGDADALRVRVAHITVRPDGVVVVRRDKDGATLGPSDEIPADPLVDGVVKGWLHSFDVAVCGEDALGCLDQPLTVSRTALIAEETTIRRFETNLGDWVADHMLRTFADDGVQVAFVNSGALRLNQDVAAGTPLTTRIVEELFAYSARMHVIDIDADTLRQILERSVGDWTGSGHWLQVGGVAFRHDPATEQVTDITLLAPDGPRPLGEGETIRAVTVQYLLDPSADQDGYTMLGMDDIVESPRNGTDLKAVVLQALRDAGEAGIGPEIDGRICNPERPGPCLAR
jgi:2',3'-cyclic-nucleotide 2'-phosphodiesterase (5'-nucleotidase family)